MYKLCKTCKNRNDTRSGFDSPCYGCAAPHCLKYKEDIEEIKRQEDSMSDMDRFNNLLDNTSTHDQCGYSDRRTGSSAYTFFERQRIDHDELNIDLRRNGWR